MFSTARLRSIGSTAAIAGLLACGNNTHAPHSQPMWEGPVPTCESGEASAASDCAPPSTPTSTEDTSDVVPTLALSLQSPTDGAVSPYAAALEVQGTVSSNVYHPSELAVSIISSRDGAISINHPGDDGAFREPITTLTPGWHELTVAATDPLGTRSEQVTHIGICRRLGPSSTFNDNLASGGDWHMYGDAFWDNGGWLEMTGTGQGRKGAIFNIAEQVAATDVTISFRIWSGGGTGADGFAMSVIGAESVAHLEQIIGVAARGGGLGYAYGVGFAGLQVPALHVEFDTWKNQRVPNGDVFDDPTDEDHIAVTLDGNPGNHHLWAAVPNLEDSQWHAITVQISGTHVSVLMDGEEKLSGDIAGFNFKGGYIGFSGTTGYYTNYHRIDDLEVACTVPN